MKTEIQDRADFTKVRYGQCWEDADVLVAALEPAGRRCVSIGSAGDNSFSLLAEGARHVTAVEINPAQVACIELRGAAYLHLDHEGMLELLGVRDSARRADLYAACREALPQSAREFWEADPRWLEIGAIGIGRFENYFKLFRERVLPLAHSRRRVSALLENRRAEERRRFHDEQWDNRRWRWIFGIFFSRRVMGRMGRDPEFFRYVEGSVAARILDRTRHALVALQPATNPYLHWILKGGFDGVLPHALRREHFDAIRKALADGRLAIHQGPLESWLDGKSVDAFNLSDIFEYMNEANSAALLERLVEAANPGARLAYWNMLAPRSRPAELADRLVPLEALAERLFNVDKAFFYSRFVVEEVRS